jgi:hypothetical protein
MFSASRALRSGSVVSKLEVERKFVPSPLLKKYARETATAPRIDVSPATDHNQQVVLTRLPRKRMIDKYFDHKGQLERKGIWVRWRREETTTHDGLDTTSTHASWEAKLKQGGDFLDSQFIEAEGREAVESLMAEAGVCRSIYELSFELGLVTDRVGWVVNGYDGKKVGDDTATMSLVLDTVLASLEGRNGDRPTFMHHVVGELELETSVTADPLSEGYDDSKQRAAQKTMRQQLAIFMSTYPTLFDAGSLPVGKITAYKQQKQAFAARSRKANAASRLANMSEVRYERLAKGLKVMTDRWGRLYGY